MKDPNAGSAGVSPAPPDASEGPPEAGAPRVDSPFTRQVCRGPRWPWSVLAGLVAAAAVIELVLIRLTSLMSLSRFFPGEERISLDFVKMLGPDWQHNTLLQFESFSILFLAFFAALWLIYRTAITRALAMLVFLPPVIWITTAAFMYPPYAVDLFHNLADSRLLWVYHLNPLLVAPIARPFPIGTSYGDQTSAYGPLWYLLSFPGAVFQPGSVFNSLVLLKLWMGFFYIASGAVISLIVRRQRPRLALFAAAVYLWNPFVIMRDLGDGHNDVVMFFFVLLAFYFAAKGDWRPVFPLLALSALTKYASLLLVPVFFCYVLSLPEPQRRTALRQSLIGGAIATGLVILIYVPFWDGMRTFASLRAEGDLSITSTPLVVQYFITDRLFPGDGGPISRLWMRALFLLLYGLLLLRLKPPIERLQGASYQALLLFILIGVAWFRPWYLLWVVTLGALLPWGWFLALTLTISWFGMFPDIVEQYRIYVPWLASDYARALLAPIVVAFLPPALVWLAGLAISYQRSAVSPHPDPEG